MRPGVPFAGARPLGAPHILQGEALRQPALQVEMDMGPGPHVHRLLLHPGHLAQVGIGPKQSQHIVDPEWLQQLQPGNCDVARRRPQWTQGQIVVDLPGAQQQTVNVVTPLGRLRVIDHPSEPARHQVLQLRGRRLQPQQTLGRHQHQRSRPRMERLPPQHVKILGGRGWVGHPDVALRRQLQEPFQARARVLRPRPFVAVRQHQRQPRRLPPLG